ncbi:hypothetical protein SteCoe_34220 [Stentor coeruleus]|uniref:ABC transporter domain-containing protein n=1 Tax=Stentor coeruleus TaxID=5963 RepID=A0A1R2AV16_9CILI|nr:hypothetical protein SteCoe_34220 [Stentor coeruleus]
MAMITQAFSNFSAELKWENLSVDTKPSRKNPARRILYNAKGVVHPGEFLAIMGPSGAGKTTLLNCLSGRYQKNLIVSSGDVFINGRPIKSLNYKAMIGFVPQDDILLECMTPRETITFSAALTTNLHSEDRKILVDRLLQELGLTSCADTLIGGHIVRGISGGEKKRTSIAVELVFNPSVLFLDEPTTGLDSFIALQIMNMLIRLSKERNSTIIATIHQPSSQIFNNFDKLLLMSFGSSIYMGRAQSVIGFLENSNFPIPKNYNPADHCMNVLSKEEFKNIEYREKIMSKFQYKMTMTEGELDIPRAHFQVPTYYAFWVLLNRALREMFRNPIVFKGKVMKMLIGFALCSMTFANLGNGPNDMQDHYGAIFMLVSNAIMEALTSSVATFQTQKPVFVREYCGRKYGVVAFYMSYSAAMIPPELMYAMGIYALTYYVMGLNPAFDRFMIMITLGGMGSLCGSGFALTISSVAPTIEIASALAPLLFLPMMLSGGYLVSYNNVPDWLFFQYVSPFRFLFEAAIRTDIEHNDNIHHNVSKHAIDTLHLPESYAESIWLIFVLVISLRLLGMGLLKLVSRNL